VQQLQQTQLDLENVAVAADAALCETPQRMQQLPQHHDTDPTEADYAWALQAYDRET
jgi:hypothetical protein